MEVGSVECCDRLDVGHELEKEVFRALSSKVGRLGRLVVSVLEI